MKKLGAFILLVAIWASSSCSKPEHSLIIGRWHEIGTARFAVFYTDGTVEISDGQTGFSWKGRYRFISQRKLELNLVSMNVTASGSFRYDLAFTNTNTKMSWIEAGGRKTEYLREK